MNSYPGTGRRGSGGLLVGLVNGLAQGGASYLQTRNAAKQEEYERDEREQERRHRRDREGQADLQHQQGNLVRMLDPLKAQYPHDAKAITEAQLGITSGQATLGTQSQAAVPPTADGMGPWRPQTLTLAELVKGKSAAELQQGRQDEVTQRRDQVGLYAEEARRASKPGQFGPVLSAVAKGQDPTQSLPIPLSTGTAFGGSFQTPSLVDLARKGNPTVDELKGRQTAEALERSNELKLKLKELDLNPRKAKSKADFVTRVFGALAPQGLDGNAVQPLLSYLGQLYDEEMSATPSPAGGPAPGQGFGGVPVPTPEDLARLPAQLGGEVGSRGQISRLLRGEREPVLQLGDAPGPLPVHGGGLSTIPGATLFPNGTLSGSKIDRNRAATEQSRAKTEEIKTLLPLRAEEVKAKTKHLGTSDQLGVWQAWMKEKSIDGRIETDRAKLGLEEYRSQLTAARDNFNASVKGWEAGRKLTAGQQARITTARERIGRLETRIGQLMTQKKPKTALISSLTENLTGLVGELQTLTDSDTLPAAAPEYVAPQYQPRGAAPVTSVTPAGAGGGGAMWMRQNHAVSVGGKVRKVTVGGIAAGLRAGNPGLTEAQAVEQAQTWVRSNRAGAKSKP